MGTKSAAYSAIRWTPYLEKEKKSFRFGETLIIQIIWLELEHGVGVEEDQSVQLIQLDDAVGGKVKLPGDKDSGQGMQTTIVNNFFTWLLLLRPSLGL